MKRGQFAPCSTCKVPVWVYPSRAHIRYHCCSIACQTVAKRTYQKEAAKHQLRRIPRSCKQCGKLFEVHAYRKNSAYFCSCSCRGKFYSGSKASNWQGGIVSENAIIRSSVKMKLWRTAVFTRDNFACTLCGAHNVRLNADHIKAFSKYPDLRLDVNNGRTLCEPCHRKTPNFAGRAKHG